MLPESAGKFAFDITLKPLGWAHAEKGGDKGKGKGKGK